ncbi:MAG: type II toxin-antitoxin system VapB family antitoxin [Bryobacterales bacterium]|nr:type II toxin-antitoxin system VapB family antitoxin [Bryobacterales bacterium]
MNRQAGLEKFRHHGLLAQLEKPNPPWLLMSLNIRNPQVRELAAELARLRGVSLGQAVLDAVQNALQRENMDRQVSSADHAAMLYDDQGLPKGLDEPPSP